MSRSAIIGVALLVMGALSACTPKFLAPDDRARVCRVGVEEKPEASVFQQDAFSNPVGAPLLGAGLGALAILALNPLAPLYVLAGVACGVASAQHPNAEIDFRRIFQTADRNALSRGLKAELDARLAGCQIDGASATPPARPDTVIQIESVEYLMECPMREQTYTIAVKWRAMAVAGNRVLSEATTRCRQVSSRDVDAWSADAEQSRAEVELALVRTGQRIAAEFLATDELIECRFSSKESADAVRK